MRNEEPDMPLKEQHKHKIKNKEKIEDLRVFLFFGSLCAQLFFDLCIKEENIYLYNQNNDNN